MQSLKSFAAAGNRFIVAHRGASMVAPENTLAAFELALDCGAMMLETDVQLTRDKQVVAFHDSNLIRTGGGETALLASLDYAQIAKIDVGSWFSDKFANQNPPLLEDVLKLVQDRAYLMIELKTYNEGFDFADFEIIKELIEKYEYLDKVIFGSFDHRIIRAIKDKYPEIGTTAIKIPGTDTLPSELKAMLNNDAFVCSIEELNETIANDAKDSEIYIAAYSADNKEQMIKAINAGAKAIVTNNPCLIAQLLNDFEAQTQGLV